MGRLLLVHFSDIHIGSTLTGTRRPRPFHWLSGHSLNYCQELQAIFQDPKLPNMVPSHFQLKSNEDLHFVLSGDLTRVGSLNDFYLAYEWLLGSWSLRTQFPSSSEVGLKIPPGNLHCVPGNHDQWRGKEFRKRTLFAPPAFNANLVPDQFNRTPWSVPIGSPEGDFVLDLIGVDSNSGLRGKLSNRFGGGMISPNHFTELEQLLSASAIAEEHDNVPHMRCIVCHHSFIGTFLTDGLHQDSIDELSDLSHEYGVTAVLTGHIHSPLVEDHHAPDGHVFWEVRAPSAVQHGSSGDGRGFWVHELTYMQGKFGWKAALYESDANQGPFSIVAEGQLV